MICHGCGVDRTVTVSFRDARGAVQTRCVRCGGAESGPQAEPAPMLRDVKGRKKS